MALDIKIFDVVIFTGYRYELPGISWEFKIGDLLLVIGRDDEALICMRISDAEKGLAFSEELGSRPAIIPA